MVSETPTQPKRQNAAAVANSIPELKAKAAMVVESLANGDMAKKSKEFVDEKVNQVSSQSISTVLLQVLYFAAAKVFSVIMFLLSLVPEPAQKWFEKRVMTDNRDIFLCICILPISVVYDLLWRLRRVYLYQIKKTSTRSSHVDRVKFVQEQIRNAPKDKAMCTARPGWLAMSFREGLYKNTMTRIDVSQLDNVLEINEEAQTVFVEPNCSMGQVTRELIPRGWTLAVVPELDDLTVGGLINGFGIETSSHKYGLFQHTCVAYEIVLPTGEVVRANATENPDLFAAIPFSHGSLGFLVGAEIKIVPALPFVHMSYLPCHSLDSMVSTFTYASRSPDFDFVELLTYSKDTGVVMVGKMTEHETVKKLNKYKLARAPCVNAIGKFWKPWFFKYVESYLANGVAGGSDKNESAENFKKLEYLSQLYSSPLHFYSPNAESKQLLPPMRATELEQDLIPLRDYYHRHTKAIFWELQDIIPFGNEPWFRYTLGWAVPPQVSMLKLTTTEKIREIYSKAHVIQDLLVPINTLRNSLLKFHEELECYPLWVCPMRLLSPPSDKWVNTKPANIDPDLTNQLPESFSDARLLDNVEFPLSCPSNGGMVNPTGSEQLYVDIGAYGIPRARQWEPAVRKAYGDSKIPKRLAEVTQEKAPEVEGPVDNELHIKVMRRLEDFVRKNHGFQALYADCFQTRKEFREMFDHRLLDRLRNKYGCVGRLPDVFDKVSHEARR